MFSLPWALEKYIFFYSFAIAINTALTSLKNLLFAIVSGRNISDISILLNI